MQQRLTLSRQVFYFGLALMLGAGILSATRGSGSGLGAVLLVLTGAGLAIMGRLWHQGLLRSARRIGRHTSAGGYRLNLLGDSRFTS